MYVKNGKRTIKNKYYKIENRKQQHTSTDIEKQKEHNTTKQKQKLEWLSGIKLSWEDTL